MTAYGGGNVYLRGKRWWIRYPGLVEGRPQQIREPAGRAVTEKEARAFLARRIREVEAAKDGIRGFVGPASRKVTVTELVEDHLAALEARGIRSLRTVQAHAKGIVAVLGTRRVLSLREVDVLSFITARRGQKAAEATIDRELEVLRGALRRAKAAGRVFVIPEVPTLVRRHANARQGFLEPEDFFRLLDEIREADFRDFLEFFWWTAMRPGEIASLVWEEHDKKGGTLRLRAEDAKIGRARVVPLVGPLEALMERRTKARRLGVPFVFHVGGKRAVRLSGGLLDRLYDDWRRALRTAGLPVTLIPYDLRRSALRNTLKAGADKRTAMALGGWLTDSTFYRYQIVTDDDLAEAIRAAGDRANLHKTRTKTSEGA